jgi:F-type H+-transporting ATPase subunit epsilon
MFHLHIATPEKMLFDAEVESIVVPAVTGEMGVLTGHHPVIAQLSLGAIKIKLADSSETVVFISSGYLEVNNNNATILADQAENIDEIAAEQAKAARQKAEELLKTTKDTAEIERIYQELKMHTLREQLAGIAKYRKEQK